LGAGRAPTRAPPGYLFKKNCHNFEGEKSYSEINIPFWDIPL